MIERERAAREEFMKKRYPLLFLFGLLIILLTLKYVDKGKPEGKYYQIDGLSVCLDEEIWDCDRFEVFPTAQGASSCKSINMAIVELKSELMEG